MTFYPPKPLLVLEVMRAKGYTVFTGPKNYNLNLVGIRSTDLQSNAFNDWVGVLYQTGEVWNQFFFPATTDPGTYWRTNPMNVRGTAILKPGQYLRSHALGKHSGYPALQQVGPLTVFRDADKDETLELDPTTMQTGLFAINIHRAAQGRAATRVDRWSAGCQVLQDAKHFEFLMTLVTAASSIHGPRFSYTLLEEADFNG